VAQHVFARIAGATDAQVKQDLRGLPDLLDEVDRLIVTGVIGADQLTAADLQIAPSLRALLAMTDLARLLADRRCCSRSGTRWLRSW
jgi:3-phosphoglycerate kinase